MLSGDVESVAVVIPRGARWPVPAYELALILAWRAAGTRTEISLITSEGRPLAALGTEASTLVLHELLDAGVHLTTGAEVVDEPRDWAPHMSPELVLVPEPPTSCPKRSPAVPLTPLASVSGPETRSNSTD